jgi:putative ABC transport system permease protein
VIFRLPLAFARLLVQSAVLALGQIWANKMRAALTTLGIVIGVASVTAVVAALTGMRSQVLNEFEAMGTNRMFIYPTWPETGRHKNANWEVIRFRPEQFDGLLEHCPSVQAFTRVGDNSGTIKTPGKTIEDVTITGIDAAWHEIEGRAVVLGRPFSPVDEVGLSQVCLITPDLRDKLLLDRDCIGDTLLVSNRTFRIVGLIEPLIESAMFGRRGRTEEVLIPFTTWRKIWSVEQPFFRVQAISKTTALTEEAAAEVRFFLRKARNLRPDDPDTFGVEVVERYLERFKAISQMVLFVAAGIVGISLLVGGVGIMNIMLVSVSERTREIGLRKAVGARPSAILLQFLVEAVMLCFMGGLVGVLIGQAMTTAISSIPGAELHEAHIPLWAIGMSFGFAAGVGLIFGMFPALKAARLDPIEALRHE